MSGTTDATGTASPALAATPQPLPVPSADWTSQDLSPTELLNLRLREFWQAGYDEAERTYHVQGWRKGFVDGLVTGVFIGALAMWAALMLGKLLT